MYPNFPVNIHLPQSISQTIAFNTLVAKDATEGCAYLTPESLMAYCQSRLQGIDTQVNEAFAEQQQSNFAQQVLGQLAASPAFKIPTADNAKAGAGVQAIKDALEGAVNTALSQLDPQSPAYAALQNYKTNTIDTIDINQDLPPDTFNSTIVGGLSNIQKDLNSSSELSMINLQALMSQRQSAVQMCTNLVQSLGDQMNKIAQNIGH